MTSEASMSGVSQQTAFAVVSAAKGFPQKFIGMAVFQVAQILPRRDTDIVLRLNREAVPHSTVPDDS